MDWVQFNNIINPTEGNYIERGALVKKFLKYKEIQRGAVAKSYMRKGS